MRKTLITSFVCLTTFCTISISAQEESVIESITQKPTKSQHEVVVNEKMIEQYRNYMENGTHISFWETAKEHNFSDFKEFYNAYQDHEFTDKTNLEDIKTAFEERMIKLNENKSITPEPELFTETKTK